MLAIASLALVLAPSQISCLEPGSGRDLVIGAISNSNLLGTTGSLDVYSFGFAFCNVGDAAVSFEATTPLHPVAAKGIFRIDDGRFEQIGMSSLWHASVPLQQSLCCTCSQAGGGLLGAGCSDSHSPGATSSQASIGPRNVVDPTTGDFPFSPALISGTGPLEFERLQVDVADVSSATHPSAVYLAEMFVVDARDAADGNTANNASWRPLSRLSFNDRLLVSGQTEIGEPAIMGWPDYTPGATVQRVDLPGEGTLFVGSSVKDEGNGTWTYSYAVHNLNARRAIRGVYVPVGSATITADQMSFPRFHSGEPYSNAPWIGSQQSGVFRWFTEAFGANPDANAIRFGTTYSFWFTADQPPGPRVVDLELFTPGAPSNVQLILDAPVADALVRSSTCSSTLNSTGAMTTLEHADVDLPGRALVLRVGRAPAQQFGIVATSLSTDLVPFPGGSAGTLCLGGSIGRFVGGGVFSTGLAGAIFLDVDLDAMPTATGVTTVMPGETRHFQAWHRDLAPAGSTSNFSGLLSLTFP